MERLDGDLKKYFQQHSSTLNEKLMLKLFTQITTALLFIHQQDLTHRDIKPQNILFKIRGEEVSFYLADFGLVHQDPVTPWGTPGYTAPEIASGNLELITNKADIFSWGVTINESIKYLPNTIVENSKKLRSWVVTANKCMNKSPEKRPSCEEIIITHRYVDN
ncbi:unnamed protein product [Rotaria sp. Silwood2]|nr:unnamed protein product [Rotaria sp. Silwood2]